MAQSELERTLAQLAALDDKQKKAVQAMAQAIVNKLLHGPTSRLREEQGGPLAEAAAELFGLNQAPQEEPAGGARRPQPVAEAQPADVLPISGRK